MARISTYINDNNVVGADKWIGSDSQNNFQTKNFTAQSVADFINKVASESQLLRYQFTNVNPTGSVVRPAESISFINGSALTVPFNTISTFVLSQHAENQGGLSLNVSSWYTSPLIGSDVLITQCDDITQWAIFRWNSSVVVPGEPTFFNIGLTYNQGNGGLTDEKDYFISLLQYNAGGGSDKNFVSAQLAGNTSYIVTHNLNKFPAVSVSEGTPTNPTDEIGCEITYINVNQVQLQFTSNFTGVAIFN
tara:strand:+ start:9818 stop:10564 length:747 start_codon:yes stop_codon:yes gene_type:complete